MTMYRYVTPTRSGKWYPTIEAAQKAAGKIGAGFWDEASGTFYRYPQAQLEAQPLTLAANPENDAHCLAVRACSLSRLAASLPAESRAS